MFHKILKKANAWDQMDLLAKAIEAKEDDARGQALNSGAERHLQGPGEQRWKKSNVFLGSGRRGKILSVKKIQFCKFKSIKFKEIRTFLHKTDKF